MPEQPRDPIHYDMKIPPEPDPNKQRGPEKPPSDEKESSQNESASNTAKDTNAARGDDRPQSGRQSK